MAQRYKTGGGNRESNRTTKNRYSSPRYKDNQAMEDIDSSRGSNKKQPKKSGGVFLNILLVIFCLVFVGSAGYLVYDRVILPYRLNQSIGDLTGGVEDLDLDMNNEETYIEEVVNDEGEVEEVVINDTVGVVRALRETYPDMIGWLKIPNTDVQLPVMQTSTDNPEYYLYRDYTGKYSKYGSLFQDSWTEVGGDNQVIYGHHMKDGNMFACLEKYTKLEYYQEAPVIQYDTYQEAGQWKIISVFKANTYYSHGEPFIYNIDDFSSDEDKMEFIYQCKIRSIIDTGVDVTDTDEFITLSTCSYEFDGFRTVVVARKVREGEDTTVDVSKADYNSKVVYPDVWYHGGSAPKWPETLQDAVLQGMADWYIPVE